MRKQNIFLLYSLSIICIIVFVWAVFSCCSISYSVQVNYSNIRQGAVGGGFYFYTYFQWNFYFLEFWSVKINIIYLTRCFCCKGTWILQLWILLFKIFVQTCSCDSSPPAGSLLVFTCYTGSWCDLWAIDDFQLFLSVEKRECHWSTSKTRRGQIGGAFWCGLEESLRLKWIFQQEMT